MLGARAIQRVFQRASPERGLTSEKQRDQQPNAAEEEAKRRKRHQALGLRSSSIPKRSMRRYRAWRLIPSSAAAVAITPPLSTRTRSISMRSGSCADDAGTTIGACATAKGCSSAGTDAWREPLVVTPSPKSAAVTRALWHTKVAR